MLPASALSGGQRSRVALAAVSYAQPHVLARPHTQCTPHAVHLPSVHCRLCAPCVAQVLILDEPTNNPSLAALAAHRC